MGNESACEHVDPWPDGQVLVLEDQVFVGTAVVNEITAPPSPDPDPRNRLSVEEQAKRECEQKLKEAAQEDERLKALARAEAEAAVEARSRATQEAMCNAMRDAAKEHAEFRKVEAEERRIDRLNQQQLVQQQLQFMAAVTAQLSVSPERVPQLPFLSIGGALGDTSVAERDTLTPAVPCMALSAVPCMALSGSEVSLSTPSDRFNIPVQATTPVQDRSRPGEGMTKPARREEEELHALFQEEKETPKAAAQGEEEELHALTEEEKERPKAAAAAHEEQEELLHALFQEDKETPKAATAQGEEEEELHALFQEEKERPKAVAQGEEEELRALFQEEKESPKAAAQGEEEEEELHALTQEEKERPKAAAAAHEEQEEELHALFQEEKERTKAAAAAQGEEELHTLAQEEKETPKAAAGDQEIHALVRKVERMKNLIREQQQALGRKDKRLKAAAQQQLKQAAQEQLRALESEDKRLKAAAGVAPDRAAEPLCATLDATAHHPIDSSLHPFTPRADDPLWALTKDGTAAQHSWSEMPTMQVLPAANISTVQDAPSASRRSSCRQMSEQLWSGTNDVEIEEMKAEMCSLAEQVGAFGSTISFISDMVDNLEKSEALLAESPVNRVRLAELDEIVIRRATLGDGGGEVSKSAPSPSEGLEGGDYVYFACPSA